MSSSSRPGRLARSFIASSIRADATQTLTSPSSYSGSHSTTAKGTNCVAAEFNQELVHPFRAATSAAARIAGSAG